MPLFTQDKAFAYDVVREGEEIILKIAMDTYPGVPSLEDDEAVMARTIDLIREAGNITKIVYTQRREYEYDEGQTQMLAEIARLQSQFVQEKIISYGGLQNPQQYAKLQELLLNTLKADPIGCYVMMRRMVREEEIRQESGQQLLQKSAAVLKYAVSMLGKTRLIQAVESQLAGHEPGKRELYRQVFHADVKPDFMFSKLQAAFPIDAEEIDSYQVGSTQVTIFSLPGTVQYLYHIIPPEFSLSEEQYEILDAARTIMAEHSPTKNEFVDPERARQVFSNISHDLIEELAESRSYQLRVKEIDILADILVRYTIGFGLLEIVLADEKVQDVTLNSPMGKIPLFIVHQDFGDCRTNIYPTITDAESWASKLRMASGRPLDEANPILDTELLLPGSRARVAVIAPPLNPTGLAYALRRHRDKPWTLPLFMKNKMIDGLGAGLLSFIIDGSRTMLIAGTRSAGKTAFLSSLLVEIMRKYRIITIEDTLELPVSALRNLGYNIQQMKVAAALTRGTTEVSADEGIRTTLRMGDSSLIIGEVRSTEARALYEAMRVGAMANVVAGTIHGDSPYGVYDRVVNDLGVPKTSFKATDVIIVANPVRTADGLHRVRRITQITEVRKQWENDPLAEHGFVDLMKYDVKADQLLPTPELISGESDVLKQIAANVKEWAGNWDAVWQNILLRKQVKEAIVEYAAKLGRADLLEADFVVASNDEFHRIADKVNAEAGLDTKRIFFEWNEWLKRSIKQSSGAGR
ncbi:CpaF family protein [Candidatus Woesearchaeota archaeon]|nr:CpaF family protein [Candidatus Woesearchaeota archaeon]